MTNVVKRFGVDIYKQILEPTFMLIHRISLCCFWFFWAFINADKCYEAHESNCYKNAFRHFLLISRLFSQNICFCEVNQSFSYSGIAYIEQCQSMSKLFSCILDWLKNYKANIQVFITSLSGEGANLWFHSNEIKYYCWK